MAALTISLLAGCAGPQSILEPAGPKAQSVALLWWGMLGFACWVLVVIVSLWVYALRRDVRAFTAEQSRRLGLRWIIGGGVLLPALSIIALLALGLSSGRSQLPLPLDDEEPLRIDVIGHRWWWEVRYPEAGVATANHLVLPVGRAVDIHVTTADVIHSFWVPRLGGKTDMIPGRIHVTRLYADRPGRFRGQCAEFCGAQHAHMALSVEAKEKDRFAAWIGARQRSAPPVPAEHERGANAFRFYCAKCHRVAGISKGRRGPDLTDVGSRPTLGAGVLPGGEGALRQWLREHQALKPGNLMPDHGHVPPDKLDAIADWLETLAP